MGTSARSRAVEKYRKRLSERGLRRYEVLGLPEDQKLIRRLAKRLAENDAEAVRLRSDLAEKAGDEGSRKGGVLAALLRAPRIEDGEIDFSREWAEPRDVDL